MMLISKLHTAGIRHRQMMPIDDYDHIVPSENGLRIVDFSLAEKHKCFGCPPLMPNDPRNFAIGFDCCNELYILESEYGTLDLSL